MSTVRWCIVNRVKALFPTIEVIHTYGYLTKDKRMTLKLEKTHANDAFCIGEKQPNERLAKTLYYKQKSKNNRSLQKFYDAKYIDSRDGETKAGKVLFSGRTTRNKNKNTENLHIYRSKKVKKGRVSIRRQRYDLQPHDTVKWRNRRCEVVGVQSCGKGIVILAGNARKAVSTNKVKLITRAKTIYRKDTLYPHI
jgi:hypothetical protein